MHSEPTVDDIILINTPRIIIGACSIPTCPIYFFNEPNSYDFNDIIPFKQYGQNYFFPDLKLSPEGDDRCFIQIEDNKFDIPNETFMLSDFLKDILEEFKHNYIYIKLISCMYVKDKYKFNLFTKMFNFIPDDMMITKRILINDTIDASIILDPNSDEEIFYTLDKNNKKYYGYATDKKYHSQIDKNIKVKDIGDYFVEEKELQRTDIGYTVVKDAKNPCKNDEEINCIEKVPVIFVNKTTYVPYISGRVPINRRDSGNFSKAIADNLRNNQLRILDVSSPDTKGYKIKDEIIITNMEDTLLFGRRRSRRRSLKHR
jgi:hypothetical protein